MNTSPVESFDGAGAIFNFANNPAMLHAIFWMMCAVMVLVVLGSIVHEISVGRRHRKR